MSGVQLVKTGRQAGAGVTASGNTSSTTMSDATARAVRRSREQFSADMRKLLSKARRYLGDVCWRLDGDDELIYGHRAILYARANAAFQSRFLNPNGSARLQAIMSGSSLSLQSPPSPLSSPSSALHPDAHLNARSVSPGAVSVESFRPSPGALTPPSGSRSPIFVPGTESAFFKSLLDFFYTASTPMGEVFTFLFEDSSYIDKEDALDKLSQDFLFMWRSKLFADMHIQLSETVVIIPEEEELSDSPTINEERLFPAHRAVLAVRCPYFNSMILSPYSDADSDLFILPSPPFTPASLHFILAYLYTGSFSLNRTFDLTVAMDIWRCATYLSHDFLQEEVQCRMIDMCHGFRACCKSCRSRALRLYVFSISPEVNSKSLQAQSRPIVLQHFGELWEKEIGELPYETQKDLLVEKCSQTTALNAASAMKGIMQARTRLAVERNAPWADHVRSMLIPLEDRIKHFLKTNFAEMAVSPPFIELVEGIGFSNDVLERLLALLVESLMEKNATHVYEILVGKLLLREEGIAMDARARLEDARQDILKYIKSRWIGIKALNGFERLENWCLKELSDELEQPVDDLLESANAVPRPTTKTGLKLSSTKVHRLDSDAFSVVSAPTSLRASVLNRNAVRKSTARSSTHTSIFSINPEDPQAVIAPPVPVASTSGTLKRASGSTAQIAPSTLAIRSRTPSSTSTREPASRNPAGNTTVTKVKAPPETPAKSEHETSESLHVSPSTRKDRPGPVMTKSARLRQSSTASKLSAQESQSITSKLTRPPSSTSLRSAAEKAKKADDESATQAANAPSVPRSRATTPSRPASITSVRSRRTIAPVRDTPVITPAMKTASLSSTRISPSTSPSSAASIANRRRSSVSSVQSTRSTTSVRKISGKIPTSPRSPVPPLPKPSGRGDELSPVGAVPSVVEPKLRTPPGVTLKVGIPCVVTLRQAKFKATVRYLGEVCFDTENYVGVEVASEDGDLPDDLQWTDGTIDGIKYFALSKPTRTSLKVDSIKARNSRRPSSSQARKSATGDPLPSPNRTKGLFVKPSQVVYVF